MWEIFWTILILTQYLCLAFFVGINLGYLALTIIAFIQLPKIVQSHTLLRELPQPHTNFEIPISLMMAAYNEEAVIVESVYSLLQIDYPKYEIVVVNDGSSDRTLEVLIEEFDLVELPLTIRERLPHKPITAHYRSRTHPILRVVDKENGGIKSDASNAGFDACVYSLVSPLDADTVLERDTHKLLVQPFLDDPTTIASGGAVRIVNGGEVSKGVLLDVDLPAFKPLVLFQIIEYLRAFLFSRVGWAAVDALPIISGAIGIFKRETVVEVGGFSLETHAEDIDIVLRMHLYHLERDIPYKIANVPDSQCWTEAPDTYKILRKQRVRWHRGFLDSLWANKQLFFHRKSGILGWVSFPFQVIFEGLSPIIEIAGYASTIVLYFAGVLSLWAALMFLLLAFGLGILLTTCAMLLEAFTFNTYPKPKHLLILFAANILEHFGYRQLNAFWRFTGLLYWAIGHEESRSMARNASWQNAATAEAISDNDEKESGMDSATKDLA